MNNTAARYFRNQPGLIELGFTLLEVLIAMALGAIGIIAFAGLQLKSYEVAEESRYRSNAAFIALEMAERMSSNSQTLAAQQIYQDDMAGEDYWQSSPTNTTAFTIQNLCISTSTTTTPCNSATTLAVNDIAAIKNLARATLPNGNVAYKKCGVQDLNTGTRYDCIIVAWNDAADDIQNCSLGTDGSGLNDCYILQIKVW